MKNVPMNEAIFFKKISEFPRGTLLGLLKDAYSFDSRYETYCLEDWKTFDDFFYDRLDLADRYGFISTNKEKEIGFVSWDPRNLPEYVEIGHNCIATAYKGKGFGHLQMNEALERIKQLMPQHIRVTTNDDLVPAQRMYESVGFVVKERVKPTDHAGFVKEHIKYVLQNSENV